MNYQEKKPTDHFFNNAVSSPRPRYVIQSQKEYEIRNQARKQFFNELTNDLGYSSEQIVFNAPIPGLQSSVATDVLVYEDDRKQRVFCVADVMPIKESGLPVDQLAEVVDKARRCGARFAVAITPATRWHVDVELWSADAPEQGMIASFPIH